MPHKSKKSKSFGEVVGHWGQLASGLKVNATDVPHLDGHRALLESIFSQAQSVLSEQKIQTASKQDLSRRVELLLDQGTKVASFLRHGVKQHYGTRSEKLVEFDLLPFRGKAPAAKTAVAKPQPKAKIEAEEVSEASTPAADLDIKA